MFTILWVRFCTPCESAVDQPRSQGKWVVQEDQDSGEESEGEQKRSRGDPKLKFVVTTDLPKDRWFLRFGSIPGLSKIAASS